MRGAADHTVDFGEMRAMRLDTHQQQLHKTSTMTIAAPITKWSV